MIQYLIGGVLAYTIYNMRGHWEDLFSYYEMKLDEYARLCTYDIYDLEPEESKAEPEVEVSPFEDNAYTVSLLERAKQEIVQTMIGFYFDILSLYCSLEHRWIEMTKTNEVAYSMHCIWKHFGRVWSRATCSYLLEPDANIWVDNVSIYRVKHENGRFVYNINDSYAFIIHRGCEVAEFLSEMNRCITRNASRVVPNNNVPVGIIDVMEHLIVGKYTDNDSKSYYIVCTKTVPDTVCKSNVKFISVEYTHPSMTETIPLTIPHEMFVCGNILFTNAFVLRALFHQPTPFFFDMDYKIKIVDSNINIFELKSNECIVLKENAYDVQKRE